MPYIANTPESRRHSHDFQPSSKSCRGLTCSGQPCKRRLPSSQTVDADSLMASKGPRLSVEDLSAKDNFCWQHKNQAQMISHGSKPRKMRSSDTLIEKLQLLDLNGRSMERDHRQPGGSRRSAGTKEYGQSTGKRKSGLAAVFASLCCFGVPDNGGEKLDVVRRRERSSMTISAGTKKSKRQNSSEKGTFSSPKYMSSPSETLVPLSLPSSVRTQLLKEISKPISPFDEYGYIYMFRQVNEDRSLDSALSAGLGDSILQEHSPQSQSQGARSSKTTAKSVEKGKILVKIGYTTNVQSRLSAWSAQCGVKVELLRYYPHAPSTDNKIIHQRKTPHCHRVERLIHVELADKQVKQQCACGRTHREWFSIEASVPAVRAIDEVIRRWVTWAEGSVALHPESTSRRHQVTN